jgi:hypothetical protein
MGVLLALPIAGAGATHPPQLREGLWEIRVQSSENSGGKKSDFVYKLCRDHAYDRGIDAVAKKNKNCATNVESLGDDRYSAASRCTVDGIVIVSKGLSIYQNNISVHTETVATYTPAFNGKTDETMIQDQRYVGSCPVGVKPGDRILADGRIVHQTK